MEFATASILDDMKYEGYDDPSIEDLNFGYCDRWADFVLTHLDGAEEEILDTAPPHVVVRYQGKFYDAEIPEGVDYIEQIPFYNRH